MMQSALEFFINPLLYVLPFLFVFTLVVFFHELGHFMIGRLVGMDVRTFSIGMGREIFGYTDGYGTRWKLAWIPLGGYVQFLGEDDRETEEDASDPPSEDSSEDTSGHFYHKNVYARMAVLAAGPLANFVLAIFIFTAIFTTTGVRELVPVIESVQEESAAAEAGLEAGDIIRAINGEPVKNFSDVQKAIFSSPGERLELEIARADAILILYAIPRLQEISDGFGSYQAGVLGISMTAQEEAKSIRLSLPSAFLKSIEQTWEMTTLTLGYLGGLITGAQNASNLAGPIGIAQISANVASLGLTALLSLAAILSISLGILNLLPIPILDGGHILYHIIEAVRGRPLEPRAQQYGLWMGGGFLLCVMVFVTINDILRIV